MSLASRIAYKEAGADRCIAQEVGRNGVPQTWHAIVADLIPTLYSASVASSDWRDVHASTPRASEELAQFEFLNLLHALVLVAKPTLVLEMGASSGLATLALASALQTSGRGRLKAVATIDIARTRSLCRRYGLDSIVSFVQDSAAEFLHNYDEAPFDYALFHSDREPCQALETLLERDKLADGALVAFREPSRRHADATAPALDSSAVRSLSGLFEFSGARGLTVDVVRLGAQANQSTGMECRVGGNRVASNRPSALTRLNRDLRRPRVFHHSGERGDVIFSLPAVRLLGGGVFLINPRSRVGGKSPLGEEGARALLPLLEAQPYISAARLFGDEPIDVNLDAFRDVGASLYREHLAYSHCRGVGIEPSKIDLSAPWLFATPLPLAEIVLCRTGRRDGSLDWSTLRDVQKRCLFVGTWNEHETFRSRFGMTVAFFHARDYLELAGVIAGAKLVVADQTFAFALAEGLKVPRVLEVCQSAPNGEPQSSNGHTELTAELIAHYCGN